MTDIIEDLKAGCDPLLDQDLDIRKCNAYLRALCQDAACEIERLRKDSEDWENACLHWEEAAKESWAREAKLRQEVKEFMKMCDWPKDCMAREAQRGYVCALLGYELDDTALKEAIKQAKREALLEAADKLTNYWNYIGGFPEDLLRRMAEELK